MIAIVSDIHGNLPALRAVLAKVDQLGCRRIVCLGDVTGYYAQPVECMKLLLERNAVQLLGNHDHYLANGLACPRSRTVSELIRHQREVVPDDYIEILKTLEPRHDEGSCSFVHGGWEDHLDQYLYVVSVAELCADAKFFFSGHTHVQCVHDFGEKVYCNPGSVGQPRDGDSRAAFATLGEEGVKLFRVGYDIHETVGAMKSAGFEDERLWQGLFLGAQIGGRIDSVTFK